MPPPINVRIDQSRPDLVFERILQNERGYARLTYLNMVLAELENPSITNQVLYEWLDLIGRSEYFNEGLLRTYIGASVLRQRYTKIDSSTLAAEQKRTIKNYYLRKLPFLRNPPDQAEIDQAAARAAAEEEPFNEENENNNNSTIANENNGNENNNTLSVLTRGGKRKTRRSKKTRRAKKTRKH